MSDMEAIEILDSSEDEEECQEVDDEFFETDTTDQYYQIPESPPNDSLQPTTSTECTNVAVRRLKLYAALKIIRKAKKTQKKSVLNYEPDSDEDHSITKPQSIEINNKESSNEKSTALSAWDQALLKYGKVIVTPGRLAVEKLKSLEKQQEKKKELSLIIKRKKSLLPTDETHTSPQPSSSSQHESIPDQQTSEIFPKAIIYPDSKKISAKPQRSEVLMKMSYNEVFTKDTEEKMKAQKSSANMPKNQTLSNKLREAPGASTHRKVESDDNKTPEKQEVKPIKYLIPQNLVAPTNSKKSSQKSSPPTESSSKSNQKDFEMPERPKINYDLMDALADYRVMARYLFNTLGIPSVDFDATDDYINLYKVCEIKNKE